MERDMRQSRIVSIVTYIIIACLIVGSCGLYLMQRQEKEEELVKLQYDGIKVFMEGMELSALFDDGEKLWAGTKDGIFWLDRDTGEVIGQIGDDLEMIYASGITQTEDGTIWAAHNNGVTGFLPDGGRIDFTSPEIPSGRVNTLVADGTKVWGGTLQGAFVLTKGEEIDSSQNDIWKVEQILNSENGLSCNPVNVIYYDENFIWYGSYLNHKPGGLSIQNKENGSWQYISVTEQLIHPYINALWAVSETKMLVATGQLTAGGLCVLECNAQTNQWSVIDTFTMEDNIPGEKVRWLYVDTKGHLWITTEADGLLLCESMEAIEQHPLKGIVLTEENGLSDNEIKCMVETEHAVWLGGKYGLTRVEQNLVEVLLNESQSKEGELN